MEPQFYFSTKKFTKRNSFQIKHAMLRFLDSCRCIQHGVMIITTIIVIAPTTDCILYRFDHYCTVCSSRYPMKIFIHHIFVVMAIALHQTYMYSVIKIQRNMCLNICLNILCLKKIRMQKYRRNYFNTSEQFYD